MTEGRDEQVRLRRVADFDLLRQELATRSENIEVHNLTITEATKLLQSPRPTLPTLLKGHAPLSGEMATHMEQAVGATGRR